MKWQLLSLVTVAVVIWGCDALTDEPGAGVQSASGDAVPGMTYRIGLSMTNNQTANNQTVRLAIHRDSGGNPMCVVVGGFGKGLLKVPLQLGGTGMWKINDSDADAAGTYDRYRPKKYSQQQQHDIVLHWTKKRGDLQENQLTNADGRLEYFMVTWNNSTYEYQSDTDSKSNLVRGALTDPQSDLNDFGVNCSS